MALSWTRWMLLVTGCASHAPAAKQPTACLATVTVHVIDEAARPVAGARLRSVATYRSYGPSMLPETSHMEREETPLATTDGQGNASVCNLAAGLLTREREGHRSGSIVVDHLDWPQATVPPQRIDRVTIGPGRSALIQVPVAPGCTDPKQVRVVAYAEGAGTNPIHGTLGPNHHFTLANLGPWRYWVRSEACGTSVMRMLDGRNAPTVLTMDRNESVVEYPEFAGGTLTLRAFGESQPVLSERLGAEGIATLVLPASPGGTFCLMLQKDDRCTVTYTRAGEIARPRMYLDRDRFIARDCAACPAPL